MKNLPITKILQDWDFRPISRVKSDERGAAGRSKLVKRGGWGQRRLGWTVAGHQSSGSDSFNHQQPLWLLWLMPAATRSFLGQ